MASINVPPPLKPRLASQESLRGSITAQCQKEPKWFIPSKSNDEEGLALESLVRSHRLPEWKNPNGSAIPISYGDILKAEGKSALEISAVEDELEELAEADLLLAGH